MAEKIPYANVATLRARFAQAAGDEADAIAQSVKPKMFAKAEDRDAYHAALLEVEAHRRQQSAWASKAADDILAAAGFRNRDVRGARRR
jgi:glucan phosphorylase